MCLGLQETGRGEDAIRLLHDATKGVPDDELPPGVAYNLAGIEGMDGRCVMWLVEARLLGRFPEDIF